MNDTPQTVAVAAEAVIQQGVLGALLVLSVAANVGLLFMLINCYRNQINAKNQS